MNAEAGDKVRFKSTGFRGSRGLVESVNGERLVVRLEDKDDKLTVFQDEVVNFSLAARKAWVSRPNRRVGRPKGSKLCDRISVTLRIDRDLWEQFRLEESAGSIEDRTATINSWLREKLGSLGQECGSADAKADDR